MISDNHINNQLSTINYDFYQQSAISYQL